jgi:hypothetical protein
MDKETEVKININSGGKIFFYKGFIKSEDDYFITFKDNRLGLIRLNKSNVISIVPLVGGAE